MQFWWPFATRSRIELLCKLVANCSSQLHKTYQTRCTYKNSWWWAERLPETCRVVIPTKLEFGATVCFIHKESVRMHGHTIVKNCCIPSSAQVTEKIILMLTSNIARYHFNYPSRSLAGSSSVVISQNVLVNCTSFLSKHLMLCFLPPICQKDVTKSSLASP